MAGELPDPCWFIESVEQIFDPDGRSYRLVIEAARREGACAQVVQPFEVTLPIVGAGLASGPFDVTAGEHTTSFEIKSLGGFPGFDVPSKKVEKAVCLPGPGLCFVSPREWERTGLEWESPPFWGATLGVRWWDLGMEAHESALPGGCEVHDRSPAILGWARGVRVLTSEGAGALWSERVFVPCGREKICEFWVEAGSEPMLDSAAEAFWRMIRFTRRF